MTSPALAEQPPAASSQAHISTRHEQAGWGGAQILGWLLVGLANLIATWLTSDIPPPRWSVLALQHAYDLGHALSLGLLSWLLVRGWQRGAGRLRQRLIDRGRERWAGRVGWLAYMALAVVSMVLAQWLLKPDLLSAVGRWVGLQSWGLVTAIVAALVALVIPVCLWAGRRLSRLVGPHPLWLLALVLAVGHQLVLSHLYLGLHAYVTWCAALLAACGLAPLAARLARGRWADKLLWRAAGAVVLLALAALALLIRVPAAVQMKMLQTPGSLIAQWRHLIVPQEDDIEQPLTRATGAGALNLTVPTPPTPRAELGWLPDEPIVILIGVDAMRADVLQKHPEQLPAMSQLRREGVSFSRVWSSAPSTISAVSTLFSGRYASQLRWEPLKTHKRAARFPHNDTTPRVGELLTKQGIFSGVATHMPGMKRQYGLTRGIQSHFSATRAAKSVFFSWKRWMSDHYSKASLCYVHYIDAHNPYNLAGPEGSDYERYVRELAIVDSTIAKMRLHLRMLGVSERVVFILFADHGEAFGEHNSQYHGSTVFDEQTRIPLVFHSPALAARRVETQVSLVDLPPTLLDLFGVAAPGQYMGHTLLPSLQGHALKRDQPIFIESKRYVAMVFEDHKKLVKHKSGATALYDLRADPGETRNILDEHPQGDSYREHYRRFVSEHGIRPFRIYH